MPRKASRKSAIDFDSYQRLARKTVIYPRRHRLYYPCIGLSGEVGELCNKVKKHMRDNARLDRDDLASECGDILWYLNAVVSDLGLGLGDVAQKNIDKLNDRMKRGKLGGSGDNR